MPSSHNNEPPTSERTVDPESLAKNGVSIPIQVWAWDGAPACIEQRTHWLFSRARRQPDYLRFTLEPWQTQAKQESRRLVMRLDLPDRILLYFFDEHANIQSRSFMFERETDLCHRPSRHPDPKLVRQQAARLLIDWLTPEAPSSIAGIAPRSLDAADDRRIRLFKEWMTDEPDELRFQRRDFSQDDATYQELVIDEQINELILNQVLNEVCPGYDIQVTTLSGTRLALTSPLLAVIWVNSKQSLTQYSFVGDENAQVLLNPLDDAEGLFGQPLPKGESVMYMNLMQKPEGEIRYEAMAVSKRHASYTAHSQGQHLTALDARDVGWYRIDLETLPVSLLVPTSGAILTLCSFAGGKRHEIQVDGLPQRANYMEERYWFGHKWLNYLNPDTDDPLDLTEKIRAVTQNVRDLSIRNTTDAQSAKSTPTPE